MLCFCMDFPGFDPCFECHLRFTRRTAWSLEYQAQLQLEVPLQLYRPQYWIWIGDVWVLLLTADVDIPVICNLLTTCKCCQVRKLVILHMKSILAYQLRVMSPSSLCSPKCAVSSYCSKQTLLSILLPFPYNTFRKLRRNKVHLVWVVLHILTKESCYLLPWLKFLVYFADTSLASLNLQSLSRIKEETLWKDGLYLEFSLACMTIS